ncbi:hypothetical protein EVAR_31382_1 [Eumeta japonica]|uniref:Uncharacterized protein n=1 Tax=Eumeta variegata TaxID=151549 RepID=A0A4C1X8J5_EUMVA|nr:hypothetical protein EVAR_31382_1 [Eumeta japonica]
MELSELINENDDDEPPTLTPSPSSPTEPGPGPKLKRNKVWGGIGIRIESPIGFEVQKMKGLFAPKSELRSVVELELKEGLKLRAERGVSRPRAGVEGRTHSRGSVRTGSNSITKTKTKNQPGVRGVSASTLTSKRSSQKTREQCPCPYAEAGPSMASSYVCGGFLLFMSVLERFVNGRCELADPPAGGRGTRRPRAPTTSWWWAAAPPAPSPPPGSPKTSTGRGRVQRSVSEIVSVRWSSAALDPHHTGAGSCTHNAIACIHNFLQ